MNKLSVISEKMMCGKTYLKPEYQKIRERWRKYL